MSDGRQPRTEPGAPGAVVDPTALAPRLVRAWLTTEPEQRHRRVDGALVFLDISGFTALTESLAGRGRAGAEEIRDVVNATFTAILDAAYTDGGSLLKFGGDAVLLLFDGERAAPRAARAARRMLDALLHRNPVRTSVGSIALGATVGVSAGPIDLYLVGTGHRELFALGPTVSEVIRVEGQAGANQVLVSAAVAEQLRPGDVGAATGGTRVLLRAPDAGPSVPAPPLRAVDRNGWLVVPEPLREPLETGQLSGQHRRASIGFLKLSGTDAGAAVQDPGTEEVLHELATSVQHACRRFGITWLASDIEDDGAKLILVAGIPTGDDDDSDRLVHAVKQIVSETTALDLRIGLHRGAVFSGVVGPRYRLTYTLLGDAVNLAARTMSAAEPGQVLATASVLNGLRTLYDTDLLEPFEVKGKTRPVRAGVIGAELGTRLRRRADEYDFVGRQTELAALTGCVDEVIGGRGRAVEVVGPAGIGKSRLLDELQDVRPHLPLHLVACTRFSSERPYRAVAMLLRLVLTGERHGPAEAVVEAARELLEGSALERWIPLLGPIYDCDVPHTTETTELDPVHLPARIREFVGQLLSTALRGSAGLVVEDAQWLDPESRAVVTDGLWPLVARRPWLLVLTAREPLDLPDGIAQIHVQPLPPDIARSYALRFVEEGIISLERVGPLVDRAAGNPLFLTELARAAAMGEVPDDVEALVRQRLDHLEPAAARLVAHAAVLGLEFPAELLTAVCEDDPQVGSVAYSDVPDLLARMRSGYIRFRQSLYQEVAYATLSFRERRELHGRAALALARLETTGTSIAVEARSRHHHLGGDFAASWTFSRRALASAHERWALASAARFARRSLEAARHLSVPVGERAEVWERLGDVLEQAGAYDEAQDAYRRARALHRPSPALCRKAGHVCERRGRYSQALRWYTIGQREAEDDLTERVTIEMRRCIALLRQGRVVAAADRAMRSLPDAQHLGDEALQGYLHYVLAWALAEMGDARDGEHRALAVRMFERCGDLRGRFMLANETGAAAYYAGRWDEAAAAYRRGVALVERLGDSVQAAVTRANLGEILADQGHLEEAVETLESVLRLLEVAQHGVGVMLTRCFLARALARSGDHRRADELYASAAEQAVTANALGLLVEIRTRRAEAAVFAGDVSAATRFLAEATEVKHADTTPTTAAVHARVEAIVAALEDEPEAAATAFARSADIADRAGLVYEAGLTRAARAVLLGAGSDLDVSVLPASLAVVGDPAVLAVGPRLAARRPLRAR